MSPNPSPEAPRKLGYENVPAPKLSASSHMLCNRTNHNFYIHLPLNMEENEILQKMDTCVQESQQLFHFFFHLQAQVLPCWKILWQQISSKVRGCQ